MACYITCAFAIAFLVASLYIMLTTHKGQYESEMDMDFDQKIIYKGIVKDRVKIYMIASIIAAILGLVYLVWRKNKVPTAQLVCTAVLIFFIAQMVIYMIYPKDDYMLNYVNGNKQAKAWLAMYKSMMKKFWIGFFLGLIGYGLICLALVR
jgi:cytochrome bd-type quinol oxidase subunit 2